MERVLITGAAGQIGSCLRTGLRGRYPAIRLSDVKPLGEAAEGEELCQADLGDAAACRELVEGVEALVHLGGTPVEAPWEPILHNNIIGLYNIYEAARLAGVRRIVFASSNHTFGYYRRDRQIDEAVPPRPDSRYGVSKVFGEALGRLYADKHGLEVINLRIGSFRPKPQDLRMLFTWISPRDTVQLVHRCLEASEIHFEIIYGVSANSHNCWHDGLAERIGYRPQDDAELYRDELLATRSPEDEPLEERLFHGGPFCGLEFHGDLERIT